MSHAGSVRCVGSTTEQNLRPAGLENAVGSSKHILNLPTLHGVFFGVLLLQLC